MDIERRADKIEVLEFILLREVVTWYDLREQFNYTYRAAESRLLRLLKQGLIKRIGRGEYCLTEDAYDRLDYYGKL